MVSTMSHPIIEVQMEPTSSSASPITDSQTNVETPPLSKAQKDAKSKMEDYERYIGELFRRHPETFQKLNRFIKRGNCQCLEESNGTCSSQGMLCRCDTSSCHCKEDPPRCHSNPVPHKVRIYDIHPEEKTWEDFLEMDQLENGKYYYDAGNPDHFLRLQEKLGSNAGINQDDEGEFEEYLEHSPCRLITVNHLSPNVAKLLGGLYDIPADFFNRHLPGTEAISGRLISRLPSSVQVDFDELYEGRDSFDELWPNRKIIEGHQIIRETMAQNFLFQDVGWDYFPVDNEDWDDSFSNTTLSSGFEINENRGPNKLKNVFQFNLNHRISVYSKPPGHPNTGQCAILKVKVELNLANRNPAIIIFYPRLPICHDNLHYDDKDRHNMDATPHDPVYFRSIPDTVPKMSQVKFWDKKEEAVEHRGQKKPSEEAIYNSSRYESGSKWDYAAAYDWEFRVHLEEFFNRLNPSKKDGEKANSQHAPCETPSETKRDQPKKDPEKQNSERSPSGTAAEVKPDKNSEVGRKLIANANKKKKERDRAKFVYLFGAPLFEIVGANWARLVVRRSFDLDLLEWRSSERIIEKTVEEIKSRRVAITRHQRDIAASVEVLRSLTQEERYLKLCHKDGDGKATDDGKSGDGKSEMNALSLALMEASSGWNRGRSNGLVADAAEDNTWARVFYDFFELQASMDALEKRANKIQDGILGLLSVKVEDSTAQLQKQHKTVVEQTNMLLGQQTQLIDQQNKMIHQQSLAQTTTDISNQKSELLNRIFSFISFVVVPFSVVGTIFSVPFTSGGPPKKPLNFGLATLATFVAISLVYTYIWYTVAKKIKPAERLPHFGGRNGKDKENYVEIGSVA
jgi:Mg2+ and Co2+ transporter CorA